MTAKHFIALAAAINSVAFNAKNADKRGDLVYLDTVEDAIADVCASFNPRFDRKRFLDACRGDK